MTYSHMACMTCGYICHKNNDEDELTTHRCNDTNGTDNVEHDDHNAEVHVMRQDVHDIC